MKPETRFKKAIKRLIENSGLNLESIHEGMSGVDSSKKRAWMAFTLKLSNNEIPSGFLQELQKINETNYSGQSQMMTGLSCKVELGINQIYLADKQYIFRKGELFLNT